MAKYTFLDFAEDVLWNADNPMIFQDIWDQGKDQPFSNKLTVRGKTPWATIGARLFVDVRRQIVTPADRIAAAQTSHGRQVLRRAIVRDDRLPSIDRLCGRCADGSRRANHSRTESWKQLDLRLVDCSRENNTPKETSPCREDEGTNLSVGDSGSRRSPTNVRPGL